jgi:hypothetical protein
MACVRIGFLTAFVSNSYRDTKCRYELRSQSTEMPLPQELFESYRDTMRPQKWALLGPPIWGMVVSSYRGFMFLVEIRRYDTNYADPGF